MTQSGTPYCGPPLLRARDFASSDARGGIAALFAGRRWQASFKTRVAIRRAVDMLGLKPGDEVLAPAYNCGSELDPLLAAGLKLRLYPVDRAARVDPGRIGALLSPSTRALYLTHYFGFLQPATHALRELCDRRGLFLIEDCALSLLSGTPAEGRAGDVALFCFNKFFAVPAGGALVVNNPSLPAPEPFLRPPPGAFLARKFLRAAAHELAGAGRLSALRRRSASPPPPPSAIRPDMPAPYYFDPDFRERGMGGLLSRVLASYDVAASAATRRSNYEAYLDAFDGLAGVQPLYPDLGAFAVPHSMPVLVDGRDHLAAALYARGIAATPWWAGYNRRLDFNGQMDACYLKDHVLSLPCHQDLGAGAVNHIAATLRQLLGARTGAAIGTADRKIA